VSARRRRRAGRAAYERAIREALSTVPEGVFTAVDIRALARLCQGEGMTPAEASATGREVAARALAALNAVGSR